MSRAKEILEFDQYQSAVRNTNTMVQRMKVLKGFPVLDLTPGNADGVAKGLDQYIKDAEADLRTLGQYRAAIGRLPKA